MLRTVGLMWRLRSPLPRRSSGRSRTALNVDHRFAAAGAGEAKTRLIPRLGAWGAARLQLRLTRHALAVAQAARCGPVELHLSRRHSLFKRARLQRGRDLGAHGARVCSCAAAGDPYRQRLPGSGFPRMQRAWRYLRGGYDAVVAPAEDGGYALIGRGARSELFRDIEWGSERVYAETARRLARYRWRRAAHRVGRRSASGPRAPQIAPLAFSEAARRSAMSL